MSKIDPAIELMIEKRFSEMQKDLKEDRHAQNNKIQEVILSQEKKLETAIDWLQEENAKLLKEISGLFARKWVERSAIGIGVFIIAGVSTIFWNVFSEKLTDYLNNLV